MASSTELSTISQMRWCRPPTPTPAEPRYISGRCRTCCRPERAWIAEASYVEVMVTLGAAPRVGKYWVRWCYTPAGGSGIEQVYVGAAPLAQHPRGRRL